MKNFGFQKKVLLVRFYGYENENNLINVIKRYQKID